MAPSIIGLRLAIVTADTNITKHWLRGKYKMGFMMTNLGFCKQRLLEASAFETVGNLRSQVAVLARRLLKAKLVDLRSRVALRSWAEEELSKLEVAPGGGSARSCLPTGWGNRPQDGDVPNGARRAR